MSNHDEYFYLFGKIALAAGRFTSGVKFEDVKRSVDDFAAVKGLGKLPDELQAEYDAIASEASKPETALNQTQIAERITALYENFRLILEIEEIED